MEAHHISILKRSNGQNLMDPGQRLVMDLWVLHPKGPMKIDPISSVSL